MQRLHLPTPEPAMNVDWLDDPAGRASNFWAEFHRRNDGTLQQCWAYGEALHTLGVQVRRAVVRADDARPLALAQFICRRIGLYLNVASCSRGPVWASDVDAVERFSAVRLLRKTLPIGPVRVPLFSFEASLDDLLPGETRGLSRVMTGYSTVLLDLSQTDDALRAGLEGKWRNRLSRALLLPRLQISAASNHSRLKWLLEREEKQRQDRHFGGLPANFVEAYAAKGGKAQPNFVIGWADAGRQSVAAMLFLLHGQRATYHIGWASDEGRKLNAHNAILWKSLGALRERGIRTLDLGGVNTSDLPGISRFKLGTRGKVVTLCGTYL